jgi:hypothetical protein
MSHIDDVAALIEQARQLARAYKKLTGKPLGITGEVAEFEAARLLGLVLAEARAPGYDALRGAERIQIKGRVIGKNAKPGQRVGAIKFDYPWETVMLVVLDDDFQPVEIHEMSREAAEAVLSATESKARKRGAMAVSTFRAKGQKVWPR